VNRDDAVWRLEGEDIIITSLPVFNSYNIDCHSAPTITNHWQSGLAV
jgi:hypothetical protein